VGYECVSDRVLSIKLKAKPVNLNIIQLYAPTSAAGDLDVETFYGELEATVAKIPNRELLIIMGDLNAKIGANADQLSHCAGRFGLGQRNERGERLIQFAAENNLVIANSLFKNHPRRIYTWTSPDGNYRNQIDYIMIGSRWETSIRNSHTLPGADCGSDHQLVIAKLQLKLRAARKAERPGRIQPLDKSAFISALASNWKQWTSFNKQSASTDQLWNQAKGLLETAVTASRPPEVPRKRQHWMSDATLALVEERRKLKASGADIGSLNAKSARIQKARRRDRNSYFQNLCAEVEVHANKHEARDLHQKIRSITKTLSSRTWAVENSRGETVTEIDAITEAWKQYCQSLFEDPHSRNFASTELKNEDIEPNILRDEVRAAIAHLKNGRATGRDAIPIETIKASGEYDVDIFLTICDKIWHTGN